MLKICLEERLVYRGDFALGTLMRFLPIVTQVFLWTAVFSATSRSDIAGYSRNDIVAYYLLTMLTRAFSSMPGLAGGIARSVRDGSVKKFLIQPVDYVSFLLAARVAHKLVYYAVAVVPFGLVFFLCRSYFPPVPDATTIAAFLLSLVLSFLLGFFMEATLGMLGFWFMESRYKANIRRISLADCFALTLANREGYTPQYEELEAIHQQNKDLVILAFPANDFKQQEK
ncbi:MAG: ABC-2 family transporter protein, partial [Planctomycetota bacterium]